MIFFVFIRLIQAVAVEPYWQKSKETLRSIPGARLASHLLTEPIFAWPTFSWVLYSCCSEARWMDTESVDSPSLHSTHDNVQYLVPLADWDEPLGLAEWPAPISQAKVITRGH